MLFALTTAIFAVLYLKWKITAIAFGFHMDNKNCSLPDDRELEDCTNKAIKKILHLDS